MKCLKTLIVLGGLVALASLTFAVGCEGDSGGEVGGLGGADAVVGGTDATVGGDIAVPADVATGSVPDGTVTSNPQCAPGDEGVYGTVIPWNGLDYEGKTYTCDECPGGIEQLQGTWRFYDCDPGVTVPASSEYAEVLIFDGNTWTNRVAGTDLGQWVDATSTGFYFCSQKPENEKEVKVFVTQTMEPAGAWGRVVGDVWSSDIVGIETGMNDFLAWFYDGIATQETDDDWYFNGCFCKVGDQLNGETCANPFSE